VPAQTADTVAKPAAPQAEAIAALGAAWAGASADTCAARGGEVAEALAATLAPGGRGCDYSPAWGVSHARGRTIHQASVPHTAAGELGCRWQGLAGFRAGHPWALRLEALGVAKSYLARLSGQGGAAAGAASQLQPQHLPWAARLVPGMFTMSTTSRCKLMLVTGIGSVVFERLSAWERWTSVCAGLLAGTEEAKVSAVRGAALAALQQLLDGAGGGASLPEAERRAVRQRLAAMAASERNAALAAQVRPCMVRLRCCC
jgi:hypothetical protein